LFQPISARRIRRCPECGKPKVKRLIGAGSTIIFKGSGFYQTDYRSEEYKSRLEAEKSPANSDSKNKKTKKKKNAKD
jgi:predicted nucleic acid-binding Zn ribbon protein